MAKQKRHAIEIPDEVAPLPWTQWQAANAWGLSYTSVRRLVLQGRVKAQKHGRDWLIWQIERPPPVRRGGLTDEQRAQWPKGRSTTGHAPRDYASRAAHDDDEYGAED